MTSETINIPWEKSFTGNTGKILKKSGAFISLPQSVALARGMMHEATIISGDFVDSEIVVFGLMAGVSYFSRTDASFYGIYVSSDVEKKQPNYCLREVKWNSSYKSTKLILDGLQGNSMFFRDEDLRESDRDIISKIENDSISWLSGLTQTVVDRGGISQQISYSLSADSQTVFCSYDSSRVENTYIEDLFGKLKYLFESTSTLDQVFEPGPGTFRLSYSFQRYLTVIDEL